jgi:hypothetical protein
MPGAFAEIEVMLSIAPEGGLRTARLRRESPD